MNIEKNNRQKMSESSREIGSNFWIKKSNYKNKNFQNIKWLSKFGNIIFTNSGRGAISLLLEEIDPINKNVLLPAYICESVIIPFLNKGYDVYYYDVNKDLSPKSISFSKLKNIGVFIHMGYFGFSTNSKLKNILSKIKDSGTIVVEDITHTLFSNFDRYNENDFYIGSLRKWFGIPSGGFLASKKDIKYRKLEEHKDFYNIRKEALYLKSQYLKTKNPKIKKKYLNKFAKAEKILENDTSAYSIDELSLNIIKNINIKKLINNRRDNYIYLKNNLVNSKLIKPIFDNINESICPLFFPVKIKNDRHKIRKKLIKEKIYCPIHWPISKYIDETKFKNSYEIYNVELSIPCDQRYGLKDMHRIVSVIKSFQN